MVVQYNIKSSLAKFFLTIFTRYLENDGDEEIPEKEDVFWISMDIH